mmetsp:Transcript_1016/g.2801  ORF Transcript_1016/g.2801 Transcript_1016/m.2801 type:complete len:150 (-) Transcript_1016:352-801(-)
MCRACTSSDWTQMLRCSGMLSSLPQQQGSGWLVVKTGRVAPSLQQPVAMPQLTPQQQHQQQQQQQQAVDMNTWMQQAMAQAVAQGYTPEQAYSAVSAHAAQIQQQQQYAYLQQYMAQQGLQPDGMDAAAADMDPAAAASRRYTAGKGGQ